MIFPNNNISIATTKNTVAIKALLDKAYRGEESKKGWTTEAHLIAGEVRTNTQMVEAAINDAKGNMLIYTNNHTLLGCVHLQEIENKIYLGMFAVEPNLQGSGIGKEILKAAEVYTLNKNLAYIFMKVISVRKELIDWYKRHGFTETGEIIDFMEDNITGKHLEQLQFIVLEKRLN
ncbi:MAG: GNAT family N-acetyltransferase [Chitinophagaceae bacterium]